MHTYTALRGLYESCGLSGVCIRIRILRLERLVHTDTAYRFLQRLGDSVFRIRLFVQCSDECSRFVNSFNVCAAVIIECPEDPSEGCDLQGSFAENLNVLIGLSFGSVFWVPPISYFDVLHMIHRPTLTLYHLLLSNTLTRCSNITVH